MTHLHLVHIFFFKNFYFYCTLGSRVHVQMMQDYCIGTYMAMWFAASTAPPSPIFGISPHVIPPQPPHPLLSLLYTLRTDPSV